MKHVLFTIFAAMFAMTAIAQSDGSSCEKAIYVDSLMVQSVEANTTYWFTANTDDLPLTVYFFPDEEPEVAPEIYIDFTCEPGVYEDQNIRDIVDLAIDMGIYFPLGAPFDTIEVDGATAYRMSYERDLLELLVMLGIDYSVPVYVSFRSPVSGSAQVSNIKTVTLCSELHQRVEMRDTIYLQANRPGLVYFPVTEWKDKNMSFIWNGEGNIRAYLEPDCEFDTLTSDFTYTFEETSAEGYPMQTAIDLDVDNYIRYSDDGNMYVLFMAEGDGEVYVTDYIDHGIVTINTCTKNTKSTAITFPTTAEGLALAAKIPTKSYRIQATDIQNQNIRLKWKTTENKLAVAYFANFCGFDLMPSDPDVIDTVHFVYNEAEQAMIAEMPMERVNKLVRQNTDGWLFMQIYRQEAGTFWWDSYEVVEPGCDEKSILLLPNDSAYMPANYYNTSYKMPVNAWDGYAYAFTWRGTRKAYVFIADTCSFPLAPYNMHVGKYMELNPNTSVELSKEDMAHLAANYADADGQLYLRLRSDAEGSLVTSQIEVIDLNACIQDAHSFAMDFPSAEGGVKLAATSAKPYRFQTAALKDNNVRLTWQATNNSPVVAYFADFCGFELDANAPEVVDTVHLAYNAELQAMVADMPIERVNRLVEKNADGWLFMQLDRQEAGTFYWNSYEIIIPECSEISTLILPNDTVDVPANSDDISYMLLPADWVGYQYAFTWQGTSKVELFVADTCSFALSATDARVVKYLEIAPNTTAVLTREEVALLPEFADADGYLYLRLRSTAAGTITIAQQEVIDMEACLKDAHSSAIAFPTAQAGLALAAELANPYRFQASTIQDKNIRLTWKATANHPVVAYFTNFCTFELEATAPEVIDTVHLAYNAEHQAMVAELPIERVNRLAQKNADGWLFMQLDRQEAGTFWWENYEIILPTCDETSTLLSPNTSVTVRANNDVSYKLQVANWLGYNHSFTWRAASKAELFIADTCTFTLLATDAHVLKYMELEPNVTVELTKEELASLAETYMDDFGNIYLRIRGNATGALVMAQSAGTGLSAYPSMDGRTTQLVMINQSLYIQVQTANSTEYYDLTGRKVKIME